MSTWPIAPLGTQDLDFAVVNYDFTGLTAGELAPLPPLEDAMDVNLADIATSLADQTVLIASMDGTFDDASNVLGEMAGDNFDQILETFAGIETAGTALLNDYVTLVTPTDTGSGGSGGGGSNPPANCLFLDWGTVTENSGFNTNFFPKTVYLQNNGNTNIHVSGHTFIPNLGGTFTVNKEVDGAVIQPGASLAITIVAASGSPMDATTTLTLQTNLPDPQPCVTCHANFIAGSKPPGIRCPTGDTIFAGGPRPPVKPECA